MFGRFCHFPNQGDFGKIFIAEKMSVFDPQFEQTINDWQIVFASRRELRGASHVCVIHLLTKLSIFCVLHDRQIIRHMQGDLVALGALGCSLLGIEMQFGLRDTFELICVFREVKRKFISAVEKIFRELLRKFGFLSIDLGHLLLADVI